MHKIIKEKGQYIILTIVSICIIVAVAYWTYGKDSYFVDELYSYCLANGHYLPFLPCDNQWKTAQYYLDYLTVMEEGADAGSVFYNQSCDVHPPAYYLVMNLISSLFPGVFSKWIGLSINIIALTATLILMYFLCKNYIFDSKFAIAVVAVYGLSTAFYSNLLFIRMYAMLTFFIIAILYIHLKAYKQGWEFSIKDMCALGIVSFLGFLTHYFFITYAFFLYAIAMICMLTQRKIMKMLDYIITLIVSFGAYVMVWSTVFTHLVGGEQGSGFLSAMFTDQELQGLKMTFDSVINNLFGKKWWILLLALVLIAIACGVKRRKVTQYFEGTVYAYLFLPLLADIIIIANKVSGTDRYLYPLFPIIVIAVLWGVYGSIKILTNEKVYLAVWGVSICILVALNNVNVTPAFYRYSFPYSDTMKQLDGLNCLYVNSGWAKYTANVNEFLAYPNIYLANNYDFSWMSQDEIIAQSDRLVVYIDNDYDSNVVLEELFKSSDYQSSSLVIDGLGYSKIYLVEK